MNNRLYTITLILLLCIVTQGQIITIKGVLTTVKQTTPILLKTKEDTFFLLRGNITDFRPDLDTYNLDCNDYIYSAKRDSIVNYYFEISTDKKNLKNEFVISSDLFCFNSLKIKNIKLLNDSIIDLGQLELFTPNIPIAIADFFCGGFWDRKCRVAKRKYYKEEAIWYKNEKTMKLNSRFPDGYPINGRYYKVYISDYSEITVDIKKEMK